MKLCKSFRGWVELLLFCLTNVALTLPLLKLNSFLGFFGVGIVWSLFGLLILGAHYALRTHLCA